MKLYSLISHLHLAFVSGTMVAAPGTSEALFESMLEELPQCALSCMFSVIKASPCPMGDYFCVHHEEGVLDDIDNCASKNCTVKEFLIAKNFLGAAFEGPPRDRTKAVSYAGIIGGGFAILAFIVRMVARLPFLGGTWGLDDWAMVVTMIPVILMTGLSIPLAEAGLGRDIWNVSFDNITKIFKIFYLDELFYFAAIALTKISILLFYLRIFPNKTLRRLIYASMMACGLYLVSFVVATALQCRPIRYFWEGWNHETKGKCINMQLLGHQAAAMNILLDIIVMCLPMRELSKLKMGRTKKAGIMFMFLGGGFVTAVSALRLKYLIEFKDDPNQTWHYQPIGYWSFLEVDAGIIIACLPAIRSLQTRFFSSHPNTGYQNTSSEPRQDRSNGNAPSTKNRPKQSDVVAAANLIRNREQEKNGEVFIELDEYGSSDVEKGGGFRGETSTHVEGGNVVDDSGESLTSPQPAYFGNFARRSLPKRGSNPDCDGIRRESPRGIIVRKEYSVVVEERHKQQRLSENVPRTREEVYNESVKNSPSRVDTPTKEKRLSSVSV